MPADRRARLISRALIVPVAVLMAVAASAQPRERAFDVAAAIQRATADLEITAAQRADLDRIASRYAGNEEPGIMWRVADEVRAVLTPDQIASLQERPARMRAEGRRRGAEGRARQRGEMREGRPMMRDGMRRREMRPDAMQGRRGAGRGIAAEHQEAARAAMERHREEFQALHADHEAGRVDDEAFGERARALHERMRAEMDGFLTPEARQRREEAEARRERAEMARDQVLRLTPEQREAFRQRAPRADRRDGAESGRFSALTAEQRATVAIYRALIRGARHDGAHVHGESSGDRRLRRMDR